MSSQQRRLASVRARTASWIGLTLIVLAYTCLSTAYNVANPIFEAPDEVWHYLYVRHLSETGTLPRLDDPKIGNLVQQEAFQPPLYYVTAALLTSWAPRGDIMEIAAHNFAGSLGNPSGEGNRNMSLHGPAQQFPYRGEVLTVHLVRLVTTLWGATAIIFTFLAARRLLASDSLAIAAAAVVAFTPEFLFMSAAVNNDVPVGAMAALLLWLSIRTAEGEPTWRRTLLVGVVAGAVILTKSIAAGVVVLPLIALTYAGWRSRVSLRFLIVKLATCAGTILATTVWWFSLNHQIYGSATPLQSFLHRDNLLNEAPSLEEFVNGLPGLVRSYWAVFGWFNILVPDPFYRYFDVLLDLAALGLLILIGRMLLFRGKSTGWVSPIGLVLVLTCALATLGAVFVYRIIVLAFHGRLLFGAIAALSCLLVLGWSALVPRRWSGPAAIAVALTLLYPAAVFPWGVIRPAYSEPAVAPNATSTAVRSLDLDLGGEATLIAVASDPVDGARVRPGDTITVTLYLKANRQMTTNYVLFVQLIDPVRGAIATIDTHPGHGALPTSIWPVGQTIVDQYHLKVPLDARGPTVNHVIVGLYREGTASRLPISRLGGEPAGDTASVMDVVVSGLSSPEQGRFGTVFRAEDQPSINLIQHEPAVLNARAGSPITGSLTYGTISAPNRDYTIFVHIDGPKGLIAQDDGPPKRGAFPTSRWQPGDVVTHDWKMQIPPTTAAGEYRLTTGWYDPQTGQRLATDTGDSVEIGTLRIVP